MSQYTTKKIARLFTFKVESEREEEGILKRALSFVGRKIGLSGEKFDETGYVKERRIRGFGQFRVMMRHMARMESPDWAVDETPHKHTRIRRNKRRFAW